MRTAGAEARAPAGPTPPARASTSPPRPPRANGVAVRGAPRTQTRCLYQNIGTATAPSFVPKTETDQVTHHPFFSSGAPNYTQVRFQDSFGINVYDLDGDGFEDIITAGTPDNDTNPCRDPPDAKPCSYPTTVFRNTGPGYETVSGGHIAGLLGNRAIAFADINRDGKIDVILSALGTSNDYYFINNSSVQGNGFLSIEILGPNGERNQQGRVVQVRPRGSHKTTYTRVVDGGSGYHAQNQYALLIGTSYRGIHLVKAFYASSSGTAIVTFSMEPGRYAKVFAPSAQYPRGRVITYKQNPPAAPMKCMDWLWPALDLLLE